MERHISKKLLAGICALSAGFILASCDPITAVPSDYSDKIIENVDYDENTLGTIYDQVDAERNSKIVSNKLKEIAIKKFGSYKEINDAWNAEHGSDVRNAYLDGHSEFFGTKREDQEHRFEKFHEDIMERISEYFYNEIMSGSYNDEEGRFDEKKLYMAHYYEFYDITEPTEAKPKYVTNELTKYNAVDEDLGYIHLSHYSNAEGRGYIEEKVFPDILKDKLVEDYVYRENQSSIGRSYARKVSYLKVSYSDDHVFSWDLLKNFAEKYIDTDTTAEEINFDVVTDAIKGFAFLHEESDGTHTGGIDKLAETGDAFLLLKETIGTQIVEDEALGIVGNSVHTDAIELNGNVLIPEGNYYKETKLGALIVSFKSAAKAEEAGRFATANDAAELAKFTGNGKSKEYGLREELVKLAKEDYTTDGWFVKSGGLSELPSEAIRNRLFNIRVANTLDATEGKNKLFEETPNTLGDYEYKHDAQGVKTDELVDTLPYLRNINGKKVILPAGAQPYAENHYNYIHQDKEGKAFYIVQVLEAPSKAKLSEDSSTKYTEPYKIEDVSRQVAKLLGTKESYTKDAYTEYLNKYSNFKFYDSSLYEYLKAEFPDLNCFEDEGK